MKFILIIQITVITTVNINMIITTNVALTIVHVLTDLIIIILQWSKYYEYQPFNSLGNRHREAKYLGQIQTGRNWWCLDMNPGNLNPKHLLCILDILWLGSDIKDWPYFSYVFEQSMMTKLSLVQKKIYSDSLIYLVHWTHKFTYSPINPSKTKVKDYLFKETLEQEQYFVFLHASLPGREVGKKK